MALPLRGMDPHQLTGESPKHVSMQERERGGLVARSTRWPVAAVITLRCRAARHARRHDYCLFATPCGQYVEEVAEAHGVRAALVAASERRSACQPGYEFEADENGWWIRCVDGSTHEPALLSRAVHDEAMVIAYLIQHRPLDDE